MTELPIVSGKEVVKALQRAGYFIRRQRGSHVRMYHNTKPPVTVPLAKTIKKGTLRKIPRAAELEPADFVKLLKS
ncbi:MAG: addiction module toxin, HicA family [candidate division Zixibacteria bacterium]|nr:addiction module toxin, HicA family [candidate division Zixibacteria bacterium]